MKTCPKCHNTFEDTVGFCPRDGEVLEETSSDMVGQVLDGQYEVEAFIARGGMGAVYRARHILLGDRVVIKTLRSEMRNNSEWLRRFQREGRAARSFRHPNSVTVYDLRTTNDGMIYMVMEYVEGRTLDKELKEHGRFSPAEAFAILEPVASVLDAAHAKGVVHRDLKPENVMLGTSADGRMTVKLLDLGIAKMRGMAEGSASEGTSLTVAGQILGTPYYMSPEQWGEMPRDGNPEVDGRTDIYSLGVMFYELIAGRKPLGGRTLSELRHEHVSAALRPLSEVAPGVPEAFSRAISRAMAKDRNDRQATAGELSNELRAALGMPLAAQTAGVVSATGAAPSETSDASSSRARDTARDLSAATVVTSDLPAPLDSASVPGSAATSANSAGDPRATVAMNVAQPTSAQMARPAVQPAAATSPANVGAATVPSPVEVPAEVPRPSPLPKIIGAAVVVLLLLCVGVGLVAWKYLAPGTGRDGTTNTNKAANTNNGAVAAANKEVLQYWLEGYAAQKGNGVHVAAVPMTMVSGQQFRFHFVPKEHGYLYMIGPGPGNAPITMLTAQPSIYAKTNELKPGEDFTFPSGESKGQPNVFQLDPAAGTDEFTLIFSPQPLLYPEALIGDALRKLKPSDLKQLEEFQAQHRDSAPIVNVKDDSGGSVVAVAVPGAGSQGQPTVFKIDIEHK